MSHAERCPVCLGSGKLTLSGLPHDSNPDEVSKPCHGCGGIGWVTVADPPPVVFPLVVVPQPVNPIPYVPPPQPYAPAPFPWWVGTYRIWSGTVR